VFDFITSDDPRTKVEFSNGESLNYLPTKNFKLTVDADAVLSNGVITTDQKDRLAKTMEWKYPGSYMTKDNLAMLDIIAHNNWKRPICFTTTMATESMMGLLPYLYKEGFTYHLIPFKHDTAISEQDEYSKTNSSVMYNTVMNKFKYGNYKTAKYLDNVSTLQFYSVMENTFINLTQGLMQDGKPQLALNALHKFDAEMPDINPDIDTASKKYLLADAAYKLHDAAFGKRYIKSVDGYITDQLDYNYNLMQNQQGSLDVRTVQISMSLLNAMVDTLKQNNEAVLSAQLLTKFNDYRTKFAPLVRQ